MSLNKVVYVIGVVVAAAVIGILIMSGSDLEDVIISSNPDHVIASKDCGAAVLISADDLKGTTQQLGMLGLLGDCINTEEIESVQETRQTIKSIAGNVEYEWPESIGDTPDNPIRFPYTLDENYMTSDTGIGGCEITINGMDITRGEDNDRITLDMEVKPVRDIEYCQLNGIAGLLEALANTDNDRAQGSKAPIMDRGDILVKIYINTNFSDSDDRFNTMFGFTRTIYEDYLNTGGIEYGGSGYPQPWWYFGEDGEETGTWSPSAKVPNREIVSTGYDFFRGATFEGRDRYPTSIELVFLDTAKFDEVEGNLVSFFDKSVQYSKYFEISP